MVVVVKEYAEINHDLLDRYRNEQSIAIKRELENEIVGLNERYVHYFCDKFKNTGISEADRLSCAYYGMLKAIRTFDKTRDIKFATYSAKCMTNEILMENRKKKRRKELLILDEEEIGLFGTINTRINFFADTKIDIPSEYTNKETYKRILQASKKVLTENELYAFNRLALEEASQSTVSQELGFQQSYVSRLLKQAKQKIKKEIGEN